MDSRLPLTLKDYEETEYWKIFYLEQGLKEYIEEKNEQEKKMAKEQEKESGQSSFMGKLKGIRNSIKMPSIKMPKF